MDPCGAIFTAAYAADEHLSEGTPVTLWTLRTLQTL